VRRWFLVTLGLVACGWDPPPADPSSQNDDPPFPRATPRSSEPKPLATDDCNVMRLVVGRDGDGALQRVYMRVEKDGKPALLTFDTGNPITKLSHDSAQQSTEIRNASQIRLFCQNEWLDSQPQSSLNADGTYQGLPVIGALGTNVLEGGVLEVDVPHQAFIRHTADWVAPGSAWTRLPLWFPKGVIVTRATIDGTEYWVEFDTGGWRTFLFDANADMSPPRHVTHDWVGNEVVMAERPATLALGDAPPRKITIDRSRHYPVFEGWMASTGVTGAIGISSIGTEHFILDRQRSELWLAR
jgi:hypothetical protein